MENDEYHIEGTEVPNPYVSVLLPTFNSSRTVGKAIDSIISQTFTNWEMLIINDMGSDDGTVEIVRDYMEKDPRIRLVQTDRRFGLADSLNLGMRIARGKYIARMDADDLSLPKRFEKQVKILDADESIGICGTWQRHIGQYSWTHRAAADDRLCRARMLFWCDLCHSTLMLRKGTFTDNGLFYDGSYLAEDYELWTRAMEITKIRNIPEVLGIYAEGEGITNTKLDELSRESGLIVSNSLKRFFDMELEGDEYLLFSQWNYSMSEDPGREEKWGSFERILREIWKRNSDMGKFDDRSLLKAIFNIWYKARYGSNIGDRVFIEPKRIDKVFDDYSISSRIIRYRVFRRKNTGLLTRIKGLFRIMFTRR